MLMPLSRNSRGSLLLPSFECTHFLLRALPINRCSPNPTPHADAREAPCQFKPPRARAGGRERSAKRERMTDRTITCLEDAIRLVRWDSGMLSDLTSHIKGYSEFFPRGTWFRGQEDSSWPLVPFVFRKHDQGNMMYAQSERNILLDFKLRHARRSMEIQDTFDWLCLMQHHGCPTRILDWTENVLIALFFAVRQSRDADNLPGALFVLNAFKLNHYAAGGPTNLRAGDLPCWVRAQLAEDTSFDSLLHQVANERPSDLQQLRELFQTRRTAAQHFSCPVAVWPRTIHERMARQQSVVVIHGGTCFPQESDDLEPAMLQPLQDSMNGGDTFLATFTVPASVKKRIRDELRCLNIHVASLFPELEYQADHIRNAWEARIE